MLAERRLLVADDDDDMRAWLRDVLATGALVYEAASGPELLHALSNDGPFDAVVTDVRMPAPSGLQVALIARAQGVETPFLIITAFPHEELLRAVRAMSGVSLLGKPFSAEQLRVAVRSLLS